MFKSLLAKPWLYRYVIYCGKKRIRSLPFSPSMVAKGGFCWRILVAKSLCIFTLKCLSLPEEYVKVSLPYSNFMPVAFAVRVYSLPSVDFIVITNSLLSDLIEIALSLLLIWIFPSSKIVFRCSSLILAFFMPSLKTAQTCSLNPMTYEPSMLLIVKAGDEFSIGEPSLFASWSSKRFVPLMFICISWLNATSWPSIFVLMSLDTVDGYFPLRPYFFAIYSPHNYLLVI